MVKKFKLVSHVGLGFELGLDWFGQVWPGSEFQEFSELRFRFRFELVNVRVTLRQGHSYTEIL